MAEPEPHKPPRHQDSGFYEISPAESEAPPVEPPPPLLPPQIIGHPGAVSGQTIPGWAGLLVIIAVIGWTTWCSLYMFRLLGGETSRHG
ncbi:hypothetical protein EJ04DRAFT_511950 [Polyplosphaeria fusca]|uniref:Uncharacterized protein n=1 Tax=Polyplosphaeria fusca TaxID=682080 RepID=A0A9P4V3F4_9PLEO|nr:hypothetical protein EJ04DRAFT_511950 [Polyplosphaeria fusca]